MLQETEISSNGIADEWAERSEFWNNELAKFHWPRRLRERNSNPLILSGQGNSLRVDKGTLLIREGFTHHPQKPVEHRYFKGDLNCPERILLLEGSGTLSFDVLDWLSQQNVTLLRVNWQGEIAATTNSNGGAFDRELVNWQIETRDDPAKRIDFAAGLIRQKLSNSIETLRGDVPQSKRRDTAIAKAISGLGNLRKPIANLKELRAIEAVCASSYFNAWKAIKLDWKSAGRYPIPDDWRTYFARSSVLTGPKAHKYNASHPLNAILNYAYTVKTGQLKIQAIADGYDPLIGIMHRGRRDKPAFIFDLIEPERPKVDAAILSFIQTQRFTGADFIIRDDGVCRLSPQLARLIAQMAIGSMGERK